LRNEWENIFIKQANADANQETDSIRIQECEEILRKAKGRENLGLDIFMQRYLYIMAYQ
jgi:hypothetical protein